MNSLHHQSLPAFGASENRAFRPDIEGLRAVAVIAVLLFHADIPFIPGGFVGVDVFFVISGFLITGILWQETVTTGTINLLRFWGARARRLLPESALIGTVTVLCSALILPPLQVKITAIDAITSALYTSNYWFLISGFGYFRKDNLVSPSPFQHYWSLCIEEQFYLLWPLLILGLTVLVRKARRGGHVSNPNSSVRPYIILFAILIIVSFTMSLVLSLLVPPVAYMSLPTRAWQLAIGAVVALTAAHWKTIHPEIAAILGWAGFGMIVIACITLHGGQGYPGLPALLPTCGTALIIIAGGANGTHGCSRLLSLVPLRAIGRVSYSWYLWHWPILVFTPLVISQPPTLTTKLLALALSAGLAVLTLRLVENPLRFSKQFRQSPLLSLSLGGFATAIAVTSGIVIFLVAPTPFGRGPALPPPKFNAEPVAPQSPPAAYDRAVQDAFAQVNAAVKTALATLTVPSNVTPDLEETKTEIETILSNGCLRTIPFDAHHPECIMGNRNATTTIALIGDSHAAMWRPAFQWAVDQRGWKLFLAGKASCPIVDLPLTEHFNGLVEDVQQCAQWRSGIMARLRAEKPQLVVIAAVRGYGADGVGIWGKPGFDSFNADWIKALGQLVHTLRQNGSQVLVLGPIPRLPTVVAYCLSAHLDNAQACTTEWPRDNDSGMQAEAKIVKAKGGQYDSVVDLFCSDRRCPTLIGNTVVFYDSSHLSYEYALALGPAVGTLIDRALAHR